MKVGCVKKILRFLEPGVRGRRAWDMKTGCEAEQRFLSGSDIKAQESVHVELEIFSHRFAEQTLETPRLIPLASRLRVKGRSHNGAPAARKGRASCQRHGAGAQGRARGPALGARR
jgi:hypothetical protein